MTWEEASQLLELHILPNLNLDENAVYKIVILTPPNYQCYRYDFEGEIGYKIQVGRNDFIDVPLSMLKNCLEYSINEHNSIYDRRVFQYIYPRQLNGKPCYVHSIGKLFVNANIAVQNNNSEYRIL